MREWNLKTNDPLHLIIAADAQLTELDYANDHIWELSLVGGDPAALALQTSYGLRARSMRLFPQFLSQGYTLRDPQNFFLPPVVKRNDSNFIEVCFSPFAEVNVQYEIWAASSHVLAGRFTFINQNNHTADFDFELTGLLNPLGREGRSMSVSQVGINHVLSGASEDLQLVCFMTGGPGANNSPLPGLSLKIELEPGGARQITWALAALASTQESFDLARLTTAREWEAEKTRIELLNASRQIEIHTGDADWDAALAITQKIAAGLVYSPGGDLPHPSFVLARTPEQGYSLLGDGSDYSHLWNGQTVLDAWYLSSLLSPGMEQFAAGWIENFIAVQQHYGSIDWKPGMARQRSKRLAQPLLATLTWRVYEYLEDDTWLERIYPRLMGFIKTWFNSQNDSDQDGFPEWQHPYQIGLDAIPLYHSWLPGSQGVDPRAVESPALAAFLFSECQSLSRMAALLNKVVDQTWLKQISNRLRELVESQWDSTFNSYLYRDTVTHQHLPGVSLFSFRGSGKQTLDYSLEPAQRLLVRIKTSDEKTRQTHITIHGQTLQDAQSEEVLPRQIHWLYGEGRYSTRNHFTRVDEVIVRQAQAGDTCTIETIDFTSQDISLLLPLWAGIPSAERARELIVKTILQEYLQPYGLPVCPTRLWPVLDDSTHHVSLLWNQMIVEGLLAYGYRQEAVMLIGRMMQAVILSLKSSHQVSTCYHAATGRGSGDRGSLQGLAPLGLLLQTIGLRLLTTKKAVIEGFNPFPWPINVQYRGTKIYFESQSTRFELPNGHVVTIVDSKRHVIRLP